MLRAADEAITLRNADTDSGEVRLAFSTNKAKETRSSTPFPMARMSGAPET
jgi:hypothetical protein